MGGLETDIYRDYYKLSFIDYVFIEIIIGIYGRTGDRLLL